MSRPPRLAERLLHFFLPNDDRDEILGDLAETYTLRRERSLLSSTAWYWAQVFMLPAWILGAALGSFRFEAAEIKRAIRGLLSSPGFTLVAVLSLGLGVGVTTAISGALQALLFEKLPVERPEELSLVYHTWPEDWEGGQYGSSSSADPRDGANVHSNVSYPAFELAQRAMAGSAELAGYAFLREISVVAGDGPAMAAGGMLVSGNYVSTLRLGMALGRPLTEGDNVPGARSAVLSHSYWQRSFSGDPDIVGREVRLNGRPFEIVGVAKEGYIGLSPRGFFGPSDVIVPLPENELFLNLRPREGETTLTATLIHWVRLIARTPEGTETEPLRQALSSTLQNHMVEVGGIAEAVSDDLDIRMLEGSAGSTRCGRTRRVLSGSSASLSSSCC